MISVLTIGSLYWSSVSASCQQRDGVQQCTSRAVNRLDHVVSLFPLSVLKSRQGKLYESFVSMQDKPCMHSKLGSKWASHWLATVNKLDLQFTAGFVCYHRRHLCKFCKQAWLEHQGSQAVLVSNSQLVLSADQIKSYEGFVSIPVSRPVSRLVSRLVSILVRILVSILVSRLGLKCRTPS